MTWKYPLSLLVVVVLAAAVFIQLSSTADSSVKSFPQTIGKITDYPNGIEKIEPQAFGITGPVRDLPTSVPDAAAQSAAYITKQKREEIRKQILRQKGVSEKEIERDDINRENAKRIKKTLPGAGAGEGPFQDPLVNLGRASNAPQVMPTPGLTFDGATQLDNAAQGIGGVLPPDVNGDVGLNHYVSSVNLVYKIFNKNGTVAAGPFRTNSLFNGLPAGDPCRVTNNGDPVVVYDSLADRWHISQFALPAAFGGTGSNFLQCVALSVTGDPTGAYYVWSYLYPGNLFNDYPKVGVWPDAYHMTFNQFNTGGTAFVGAGILSQDRVKALAGDPTASVVYVNIQPIDPGAGGLLPVDIDGIVPPPAGMAAVMAEYRANEFGDPVDGIRYYRWVPNFITPASSSLTVLADVALAAFDGRQPGGRGDIEQMGGANLDSISDRMMHRFVYRNLGTQAAAVNSFAGSFTVNVSGVNPTSAATYQSGIRWFEMRRTGDAFSVFDQGTHNLAPGNGASGLNNWMSSIAQDNDGNIALGFSQSGTTQRADIKIAGRSGGQVAAGTLNEGEALFFAAGGSQTSTSNRWGDYSSMNVDPVDDCTFWYTQEYYASTGGAPWSTRVGSFIYPSCTPAQKATINGTITNCSTGLPLNTASVDATGGFNRLTGAPGTYSMTVSPGTYSVSAKKVGFADSASTSVTVANGGTGTANFCLAPVAIASAGTLSVTTGNNVIEPNECNSINIPITNNGGGAATAVSAVLSTTTPGVTVSSANSTYPNIAPGGTQINATPFQLSTDNTVACATNINLTLTVTLTGGSSPLVFNYTLGVGQSANTNYTFASASGASIPAGGTFVTGSAADDTTVTITLPGGFSSTVYGTTITSLSASTNGALTVNGATSAAFDNTVLPAAFGLTPTMFPYWDDLDSSAGSVTGGGIFTNTTGSAPNRQFIIEWRTEPFGAGGTAVTVNFAIVLTEGTDTIRYIYAMPGVNNGAGATVGVQAAGTETQFTQFSFNTASLSPGLQLTGTRPPGICNPGSGTCAPSSGTSRVDFDGDGRTDLSVFRPTEGNWYLQQSTAGFSVLNWGLAADTLVPGDFNGDNRADVAIFRPDANFVNPDFYILNSTSFTVTGISWGIPGDVPNIRDYDGDGTDDVAVFRPSEGVWYIRNSGGGITVAQFGLSGDIPVSGDYDGDGRANLAVFRPSDNRWYIARATGTPAQNFDSVPFGQAGDVLVPARYDNDNRVDIAVWRPSNGVWYILQSTNGTVAFVQFGLSGDIPVPGDYDGDGRDDQAVYRNGTWFLNRSTAGFGAFPFGLSSDVAVPSKY